MRVLRLGLNGDDVRLWQTFLLGQGFFRDEIDGFYDSETRQATLDFQRAHELAADGVAGNETFGMAMRLGFAIVRDPLNVDQSGPNWPAPPLFKPLVTTAQRQQVFGAFTYVHAPTVTNREAIRITGDWEHNNMRIAALPQLLKFGTDRVYFHKAGVTQLQKLWAAWENAGLLNLVLSFDGAYAPRFVRGSTTHLSNHAFGTAFDINAAWNPLGAQPALVGKTGSVRQLVTLANEHGFFWGGHFSGRPDGMHFELAVIQEPSVP